MRFSKLQPAVLLLTALCANAAPIASAEVEKTVDGAADPDPNFAYYNFKRGDAKKVDGAADPDPNFAYYNFKKEKREEKAVDGAADPDPNFAYYNFKK